MEPFFPFIHQIPKKDSEPLPLYIELEPPSVEEETESISEESEELRVIIIDLW